MKEVLVGVSLGRSLVARAATGLVLTSPAWAAPPPVLVQNQGLLGASFAVLTLAVVILGGLEYKESKGRSLDLEIDRLAAAAAQRQAKLSNDASSLLEEEQAPAAASMAPPPPAPGPPPPPAAPLPPPPTARMPVPPAANKIPSPPPPPPPPPPDSGDTFSARLADTEIVKPPPRPPTPISFGAPSAPPVTESVGNTSGGWADLLQRVRSNEGEGPNPFKGAPAAAASNEPPKAGGDAWEALLRKTAGGPGASGEAASPFAKSSEGSSPFSPKPGVPTPNPEAAGAPGEATETVVPEFMKKTSRTISLDLNKGGSSSNPFQSP